MIKFVLNLLQTYMEQKKMDHNILLLQASLTKVFLVDYSPSCPGSNVVRARN